jgi:hypothetical protein
MHFLRANRFRFALECANPTSVYVASVSAACHLDQELLPAYCRKGQGGIAIDDLTQKQRPLLMICLSDKARLDHDAARINATNADDARFKIVCPVDRSPLLQAARCQHHRLASGRPGCRTDEDGDLHGA